MSRPLAMAISLVLLLLAAPAVARTDSGGANPRRGFLLKLGSPARAEAVEDLLLRAADADVDESLALAQAFGHAGGRAALRGLAVLLEHRDASVRLAVLDAVARVDLRGDRLAGRIRRIAREEKGPLCAAAATALGYVGDGRDMDLLLTLIHADDDATKDAAYRAMARLSGANVPYVHARWDYYWKSYRRRANLLLPQTLLAIAMDAGAPDSAALLDLVRQYAWVDLPSVRDHVAEWLHEPDIPLRTIACRLAAELRLADLGPNVEMALRFASRPALREEALRTLEALGVAVSEE